MTSRLVLEIASHEQETRQGSNKSKSPAVERGRVGAPLPKIVTSRLNLFYGSFRALRDISISIEERKITALIGPSGCGKSTFLRTLNRMNDIIPGAVGTGVI